MRTRSLSILGEVQVETARAQKIVNQQREDSCAQVYRVDRDLEPNSYCISLVHTFAPQDPVVVMIVKEFKQQLLSFHI